ncbi:uncharacterized protein LOC128984191 [Macrosteles quadrilineatus]|uniref:uncharacterized protein LOC128984191 n=1 Tax=Macrosteles quadrilineatus TaxID=74068 RepID=UPI0023E33F45|nr:uncharacterized protein LOC128984191 [Macrosteles quadrilineatus]
MKMNTFNEEVNDTDLLDYMDMSPPPIFNNTHLPDYMDEPLPDHKKSMNADYYFRLINMLVFLMLVICVLNYVAYSKSFRDLIHAFYNFLHHSITSIFVSVVRPSTDIERSPTRIDPSWSFNNDIFDELIIDNEDVNNYLPPSFNNFRGGFRSESSEVTKKNIQFKENMQAPETSIENVESMKDLYEIIVNTPEKDECVNEKREEIGEHDFERNNAFDEKVVILKKKLATVPENSEVDLRNVDEEPTFVYRIQPQKDQKPKDHGEKDVEFFI